MLPRRIVVLVASAIVLMVVLWMNQAVHSVSVVDGNALLTGTKHADEGLATEEGSLHEAAGTKSPNTDQSLASPQQQDITTGPVPVELGASSSLVTQLEGSGRVIPFATGACHCLPQITSTDGHWSTDTEWLPSKTTESTDGPFRNASDVLALLMQRRQHAAVATGDAPPTPLRMPTLRILMIGDSITRYLLCFLSKSLAAELEIEGLVGCEPEQSRGTHFLLWPSTPEQRAKTPVVLHFISDFYFPESHVAQDLSLMEDEEHSWMPDPDVIVVSRGTWDAWIRMPRASSGRHLYYGHAAGVMYMRERYPAAEVVVYGVSHQYPARYHKHSERCAMQTSLLQVRSLVYCSTRRVNQMIAAENARRSVGDGTTHQPRLLRPVRYLDFFPMTYHDKNWAANTMNSDGMHYVGPHEAWFAKYLWRLLGVVLTDEAVTPVPDTPAARSTPIPLDAAQCGEDALALNTMPFQRKLKNPAKAKGSKVKRDCGQWLADRYMLLDFHKSFIRQHWKNITPAIQYSDCIYFHKASAQRLGGVDLHWPSAFTTHVKEMWRSDNSSVGGRGNRGHLMETLIDSIHRVRTPLWDRWKVNSVHCANVERKLTPEDMREMNRHILAGIVPCGHRLVYTLRATPEMRRAMQLPTLLEQRCDMVRKNRDL